MTVAVGARSSTAGDGTVTGFTATFRAVAAAEVGVVTVNDTTKAVTTYILDTDYTVALDDDNIPTVTFNSAPASGNTVLIFPIPDNDQPNTFTPGGPLYGSSIEEAFDHVLSLIQGLDDRIGQCLRIPQGDTALAELPTADNRASTSLGFDADGVPELT